MAEVPEIALRLDSENELDDVVITPLVSLHMEFMSDAALWIGCELPNDDQICFGVTGENLRVHVAEQPTKPYRDFDSKEVRAEQLARRIDSLQESLEHAHRELAALQTEQPDQPSTREEKT
jgi:hypothetical protein